MLGIPVGGEFLDVESRYNLAVAVQGSVFTMYLNTGGHKWHEGNPLLQISTQIQMRGGQKAAVLQEL